MKKIIFTGGGTVGHVTLNLLLIPKFIEAGWEVHYIGDKKGIEYKEIEKLDLDVTFHAISTGKLRRYFSWQNLLDLFKVSWGILQSIFIMLKVRPQALFSKGGFVSVPPVIAARLCRVPVFIHESDLSMGLANRIASKFADKMYTTFDAVHGENVEHVGAVTKTKLAQEEAPAAFEQIASTMDPAKATLLFIGGSGGAKVFNDFVDQNREQLIKNYNLINLTGDPRLNESRPGLFRQDYVSELYFPLMDLADVVVTRGGSNTLFELLAMKKLHLIVPLGKEASRGDQLENAAYFQDKGYALELLEEDFTMLSLMEKINFLLEHKNHFLENMEKSHEIKSLDQFYDLLMKDMDSRRKYVK